MKMWSDLQKRKLGDEVYFGKLASLDDYEKEEEKENEQEES